MKPDKLLIVRSVGLQQFDEVLCHCTERFPEHRITVLTHAHSAPLVAQHGSVSEVVVYPHKDSYSWRRRTPALANRVFAAVVVPVANVTGVGFTNVLLFSLTCAAPVRELCNLRGEFSPLTARVVAGRAVREGACGAVAAGLSLPLSAAVSWYLPRRLRKLEERA